MLRHAIAAIRRHAGADSGRLAETFDRAQAALARRDWAACAGHLEVCFDEYPREAKPDWYLKLARARQKMGDITSAEATMRQLTERFPEIPAGYAGLARLAARRRDWPAAIERWQACLDRFPDRAKHEWYANHARALLYSERLAEADVDSPTSAQGTDTGDNGSSAGDDEHDPLAALVERCKRDFLRANGHDPRDFLIFEILARFGRVHDARKLFLDISPHVRPGSGAVPMVQAIALMFDGADRADRYREWEERLNELIRAANGSAEVQNLVIARLIALLALRDDEEFERCYAAHEPTRLPEHLRLLESVRRNIASLDPAGKGRGKVFGIGLSKTGTSSLTLALEKLGYSAVHWTNPLTKALVEENDLPLFDAFTDTSISFRFERIHARYPDARFVYTTRPVDDWVRSVENHFEMRRGVRGLGHLRRVIADPAGNEFGATFRDIQENLYCRHASFAAAYRHHDERVRSFFSGERRGRLLEFDVFNGDGWEKLSDFLGRAAPQEPFPWENKEQS